MLKREVPTGPAVDLLRKLLETGNFAVAESALPVMREIKDFLAGKPEHSLLPWAARNGSAGSRTIHFSDKDIYEGTAIGMFHKPGDAELALVAVNNFYELRAEVESAYEGRADDGWSNAECERVHQLLCRCGSTVGPSLAPVPVTASAPVPPGPNQYDHSRGGSGSFYDTPLPPAPPAAPVPAMPLPGPGAIPPAAPPPFVGSKQPRPNAFWSNEFKLFLSQDEMHALIRGQASPNPDPQF